MPVGPGLEEGKCALSTRHLPPPWQQSKSAPAPHVAPEEARTALRKSSRGFYFDSPLEFQKAHLLGPKQMEGAPQLRPIITCLLRHIQACQLLLEARSRGPFKAQGYEVRITADFSKETNDCSKAFLSLRPGLPN
ncbi:hypothetical protein NDU88_005595 [Pleurodeles waltl]|uniref:Uncharacterized protein n=1 Tax=Pleurodeles waltl TaxID=8319 RepID=A0AAV7MAF9_PLEWA|nr:hypothetical protein NDU88_005595 [Pleurodeles waltl]